MGEAAVPSLGARLRRLLFSGPIVVAGAVVLAVATGITFAWLHVLRPPPAPSATSAFIQVLGGNTNPF